MAITRRTTFKGNPESNAHSPSALCIELEKRCASIVEFGTDWRLFATDG